MTTTSSSRMAPSKRPRPAVALHPSHQRPPRLYAFTLQLVRTQPTNSLLSRILKLPRIRRRPRTMVKPTRPEPTSHEWRDLIQEFEERSRTTAPPPIRMGPVENPDQYAMLPYSETAFMVALTTVMWWLGRLLRLDAFLLLLYPLPNMYIAARHGLAYSNYGLASTLLLIFCLVGPLYAVVYLFNTGLLTIAYARALWYRWPWWGALLAGGLAKTVGLAIQLWLMNGILRINSWHAIGVQVSASLQAICQVLGKVGIVISPPGMRAVQIGIAVVVALHSFYHVFFALFSSTLILRRMSEEEKLARIPPEMPLVSRLLKRARRP